MNLRIPRSPFLLLACALAPLVAGTARAQAPVWQQQAALPTGKEIHGAAMPAENAAWIVGEYGEIFHSIDRGATWQPQVSGTCQDLRAVDFVDALHGRVVGNAVLSTDDGGATWVQGTRHGNLSTLYDVDFVDAAHGWACSGGVVMKTTDGGANWFPRAVPTSGTQNLVGIAFWDAQRGIAVGAQGIILRTQDAGDTWQTVQSGTSTFLADVSLVGSLEGWAVGNGAILHTSDGGSSWHPQAGVPNEPVNRVFFRDANEGWAAGTLQRVLHTTDGGQTWTKQMGSASDDDRYPLHSVRFASALVGLAVGGGGVIFTTQDGGATWLPRQSGAHTYTQRMCAVDALHAWSANTGTEVLYTTDGGARWERSNLPPYVTGSVGIDFVDTQNGYVAAREGAVFRSSDGGRTWVPAFLPVAPNYDVDAVDPQHAIVVGGGIGSAYAMRTTDGGATWSFSTFDSIDAGQFVSVEYLTPSKVLITGSSASVYESNDGGASFVRRSLPGAHWLFDIAFADPMNGWIVDMHLGVDFALMHTTDGGQTWTRRVLPPQVGASAIAAVDASTVWMAGGNGNVARSTDAGATWTPESISSPVVIPGNVFWGMAFVDAENGWVGGDTSLACNGSLGDGIIFRRGAPAFHTYCSPTTTSHGCTTAIGASGVPSVSAASGFVITASGAPGHVPGLLVYGKTGPASTPFGNGVLCVRTPLQRTPIQFSPGTAASCTGTYAFDFNAWIAAGHDAGLQAGTQVNAQYVMRDIQAPGGITFSDALEFTIAP